MISKRMTIGAARLCAIVITVLFSSGVYAVDFLEAAPKQTKVLFENDKVRVIEVSFKKGTRFRCIPTPTSCFM